MILLAETAPDPKALQQFLIVVGFLIGIAVNVATLVIALSGRKQKAEVSFGFEAVSKQVFEKHVDSNRVEHDRFDVRIGGVDRKTKQHADEGIEKLRAERRQDMQALHTEINDVGKKVAGLDTETKNQNAWLSRMDQKLDGLAKK